LNPDTPVDIPDGVLAIWLHIVCQCGKGRPLVRIAPVLSGTHPERHGIPCSDGLQFDHAIGGFGFVNLEHGIIDREGLGKNRKADQQCGDCRQHR